MSFSTPVQASSEGKVSKKLKNFASLDLMRGLCAFAVLLSHIGTFVSDGKPLLPSFLGTVGVQVFMLISGFLMMWHFQERRRMGELWGTSRTCLKFYTRRFFRIAPLYYFMLVLVYVFHDQISFMNGQNHLAFAPTYTSSSHDPTSSGVTLAHILSHFTFLFGAIPRYAQSNPLPDWSIGLEMQFYLFFPFIALLLVRTHYLGATFFLLTLGWISHQLFGVGVTSDPKVLGLFPYPTLLPFMIDRFLVGMLIAAGLFERENGSKRTFLLLLALTVAAIASKKFLLIAFGFTLYELALNFGCGIDIFDKLARRVDSILQGRFFKFIADTSYGVYLIHIPLLILLIWLLVQFTSFEGFSPYVRLFLMTGIVTPVVYLLSYLAFRLIEFPCNSWGHRIVKRF